MTDQQQQMDGTTQAVISVSESAQSAYGGGDASPLQLGQSGPPSSVDMGLVPPRLIDTVGFSYSSDVLQLGDPFSVTVPNPRGVYTDKFLRGQTIKLQLRNPNVKANALTLKHTGIIVRRRQSLSARGSQIQLDCADLGWHLVNNDTPLKYRLQYARLYDLLTDPAFIDPSWGIRGVAADNKTNRLLRQRVNNGRAQAAIDAQAALGTLTYIQTEPGDKIADLIAKYAQRMNRLINVSCDGYIQAWQPDYDRESIFGIELHDINDPARNRNQVLDVYIDEDVTSIYTDVTCVGEIVGGDLTLDPADQNATKRYGTFKNRNALPFVHRKAFADGDIFDKQTAAAQALWAYNRGIFDSWSAVYVVRGHWQRRDRDRAYWWESDQMCDVIDSVNGLYGSFYIRSVRCDRDEQGDRTTVTLCKPCLQASFGVYQRPPRITGSVVDTSGRTQTTDDPKYQGSTTEVVAP